MIYNSIPLVMIMSDKCANMILNERENVHEYCKNREGIGGSTVREGIGKKKPG